MSQSSLLKRGGDVSIYGGTTQELRPKTFSINSRTHPKCCQNKFYVGLIFDCHLIMFVNPKIQILTSFICVVFSKSSGTNRTNKAAGKEKSDKQTISCLLFPGQATTLGGGKSGTKQKPRGAKSGCKDKKGVQRQRGRFLGVVLCPHRHGTSRWGINMQQLLARERVCSSVFFPFPPPLLITVAFSFISSHQ